MPLTVGSALEINTFEKCRLLAGKSSLANEITWVNILEILDDLRHIEPGEFLITTAHGFESGNEIRQRDMIRLFAARKIAAIAIQIGHYIKDIPQSFINSAEEFRIPLIEIPPEASFKEITRALMNKIYQENTLEELSAVEPGSASFLEAEALEMKSLWNKLLLTKNPKDLQIYLNRYRLSVLEPFFVLMLGFAGQNEKNSGRKAESRVPPLKRLELSVMSILRQLQFTYLLGPTDNRLILLFQPGRIKSDFHNFKTLHLNYLVEQLHDVFEDQIIEGGLSGLHNNINSLKQAVDEAEKALMAKRLSLAGYGKVISYQDLGLYKLVMSIYDMNILKEIYESTIAPLNGYDLSCNGCLRQTLQQFLIAGSIKKASEDIFIHRHTMKYRISLIHKLTGLDPLTPGDAFQLNMGLHVCRYLETLKLAP